MSKISRSWIKWPAVFAVAAVFAFALSSMAGIGRAEGNLKVQGTVVDSAGHGIGGVTASAYSPGGPAAIFGPVTTDQSGHYEIFVNSGTYDFHFDPPSSSAFLPVVENNVGVTTDQTLNVQLVSGTNVLSGIISDSHNNVLSGVQVTVRSNASGNFYSTNTDVDGSYSVSAPPGIYSLKLTSLTPGNLIAASLVQGSNSPTIDLTNGSRTLNLQVKLADVHVTVVNSTGDPVEGALVVAQIGLTGGGTTQLYAADPGALIYNSSAFKTTDSAGKVTLSSIVGSKYVAGTTGNSFCANVSGNDVCLNSPLTINGDTDVLLTAPVTHNFSGVLTASDGSPIPNAQVRLRSPSSGAQSTATTDSSGAYTLAVTPGQYSLQVSTIRVGNLNIQSLTQNQSVPSIDLTSGDVVKNLRAETTVIHVRVIGADGSPVDGATVVAETGLNNGGSAILYPGDPGESIIGSGAFASTNPDGKVDLVSLVGTQFVAGTTGNTICAHVDGSKVCLTSPLIISGETTLELAQQTTHKFSGILTDSSGTPIAEAQIKLHATATGATSTVLTTGDGSFTASAPPGVYALSVSSLHVGNLNVQSLAQNDASPSIDLSHNDVVQNLQARTVAVHVTVKDAAGNPLPNLTVIAQTGLTGGGTTNLYTNGPGSQIINSGAIATTGADGKADITGLVGTQFVAGTSGNSFCASSPGSQTCLSSPLTITGTTNVLLQQQPLAPAVPINVSAASPTNNVVLSWTASARADHYDVYRDGVKIGTTFSTLYTDSAATDGARSYYVVAVGTTGVASASSITVSIRVDKTKPVVTYTVSPAPNNYGWNKTNATVAFNCSDSGSGIAECSSPAIVTTQTAGQAVVGVAKDKAGNTTSITATVKIDKTLPTVSGLSLAPAVLFLTRNTTISANAADAPLATASGVLNGEYFIDTDPGQGSGTPMTYSGGKISTSARLNGLSIGVHTVSVRSRDTAGNWSNVTSAILTILL